MKEMVLRPFAIECGLEAETAFRVLDTFFMTDFQHLSYFEHVDKRIKHFQGQVQNQQLQGQFMLQQQQANQEKYDTYHNELTKTASRIVTSVKAFYLTERQSLLRAITCLLRLMARQPDSQSIVRNQLVYKALPSNLAKSLLRCQRGEALEFKRFFESDNTQ